MNVELPDLPPVPGVYALHLRLPRPARITIGKHGEVFFPRAEYIYLGSACGPGGLRARVGRHLRGSGKMHWHIDYLRAAAEVMAAAALPLGRPDFSAEEHMNPWLQVHSWGRAAECEWCNRLRGFPGAWIPAAGFGASDCRSGCPAHLVAFPFSTQSILDSLPDSGGLLRWRLKNAAKSGKTAIPTPG